MTLIPFEFELHQLRAVPVEDGEVEFVALDVATILGHRDAEKLTRSLDDDEKGTRLVGTPGGEQQMTTVTEAGLYKSILLRQTGRMADPETRAFVKRFQRWVGHEVLPAIRKTGVYGDEGADPPGHDDQKVDSVLCRLDLVRSARDLLGPELTRNYAARILAVVVDPSATVVGPVSASLANALLPAFWAELRAQFAWDLLPFTFLADLYQAWSRRPHPGSSLSSHKQFVRDVLVTVAGDPDWYCPGKGQQIRVSTRMSDSEPLVDEYSLTSWRTPTDKAVYRGLMRRAPGLPPAFCVP